jgi:hypothetical protein
MQARTCSRKSPWVILLITEGPAAHYWPEGVGKAPCVSTVSLQAPTYCRQVLWAHIPEAPGLWLCTAVCIV